MHQFGPAVRNHFLFHYVISGKGRLDAPTRTHFIGAGQGFLIFPHQVNTYYADKDDPWEYTWIEFDGLRAPEFARIAGLSSAEPVYTPSSPEAGAEVQRQMLNIVDRAGDSPMRLIGYAMVLLDEIMGTSSRRLESGSRKLRDFYMKEAMTFVDSYYDRDFTIDEMAASCGLNRSYFGRIFKETMGESPQQFILHYRMAKAAMLLKSGKMPIAEVGVSVGYPNQLHFSRAFKSVFGISPRDYRQKHFIGSDRAE